MDYKELINALNRYSAENQNHGGVTAQAADAITDLLARAETSEARAEKAERERDAAVNDLGRIKSCKVCNHCDSLKTLIPEVCKKCHHGDKWEWRGQKEE